MLRQVKRPWVLSVLLSLMTVLCSLCMLTFITYRQWPDIGFYLVSFEPSDYLEETSVALCGLTCSILAKLLLGKERLYVRDAVHILLWLAVMIFTIFSADLIFVPVTQCALGLLSLLVALEVCLAFMSRHPNNITYPVIRRLSLDGQVSCANSDAVSEAVSSVSTSCHRRQVSLLGDSGDGACVSPFHQKKDLKQQITNKVVYRSESSKQDNQEFKINYIDGLKSKLESFRIGTSAKSDSGYTSGRSSVFSLGSLEPLAPKQTQLGLVAPFPRRIISPAKLSAVAFSSSAVSGTQRLAKSQDMSSSSPNTWGQHWSTGHPNLFLATEPRPVSMFSEKREGSRPICSPYRSPSQYYTSSLPSLFSTVLDRSNSLYQSQSALFSSSAAKYRKAASETNFNQDPELHGKAWSDSVHCNLRSPQHAKALSEIDFSVRGLKPSFTKSVLSAWRDSSSDLCHHPDDEAHDQPCREEWDRETPAREVRGFSECDSTTPELAGLTICSVSRKKPGRRNAGDAFDFFNDSEGEEMCQKDQSATSAVACLPQQGRSWMLYGAVTVIVISVATNLFLAWMVWWSRGP